MTLESTQPLVKMSTRNIPGCKAAGACGWQPHHLQVPNVMKSGSLNLLETSGAHRPVTGLLYLYFFHGAIAPCGPRPTRIFMVTLIHITLDRTPLDDWSSRRRDLYVATHNTHKGQTSMPPAGLEPASPASNRLQTHALGGAATDVGAGKFICS
jgi:hypothetical protein